LAFELLLVHSGGPEGLLDVRECDATAPGARLLCPKCFHPFFQLSRCCDISCVDVLRGGCDISWWFHMCGEPRVPAGEGRQEAGKEKKALKHRVDVASVARVP
jgi:hypothetical protein